jgi:hypothetical protein
MLRAAALHNATQCLLAVACTEQKSAGEPLAHSTELDAEQKAYLQVVERTYT